MATGKLHTATSPDTNNQGHEEKAERAMGSLFPEMESVELPLGAFLRYASSVSLPKPGFIIDLKVNVCILYLHKIQHIYLL